MHGHIVSISEQNIITGTEVGLRAPGESNHEGYPRTSCSSASQPNRINLQNLNEHSDVYWDILIGDKELEVKWSENFPSAHRLGKLPVLDLQTWCENVVDGKTVMLHEFYMKPMANSIIIPANSAVSWTMKLSTYRQEVYRILRNTSASIPWDVKAGHLTRLCWRMKDSGYD